MTRSVKTGTVQFTPLLVQSAEERCDAAFPYRILLCKFKIKDAGVRTLPWLPRELFISLVCIELPELFCFRCVFVLEIFACCLELWMSEVRQVRGSDLKQPTWLCQFFLRLFNELGTPVGSAGRDLVVTIFDMFLSMTTSEQLNFLLFSNKFYWFYITPICLYSLIFWQQPKYIFLFYFMLVILKKLITYLLWHVKILQQKLLMSCEIWSSEIWITITINIMDGKIGILGGDVV